MVVIAIDRQAVGADEIVVASVVALILSTNIIVLYSFDEAVLPGDLDLMRVGTVFRNLQTVGAV